MNRIADSASSDVLTHKESNALEARLLRVMSISAIVAVAISALVAPWRTTTGLMLGGTLSLLNYYWLHSSVAAIFDINHQTERPRARSSRYLLRYFVVSIVVLSAYQLHLVSLPATIAGLCSFVPALMFEAAREFYFVIMHREESY